MRSLDSLANTLSSTDLMKMFFSRLERIIRPKLNNGKVEFIPNN